MNLFAQCGSSEGRKVSTGIERELIGGVILRPRDIHAEKIMAKIDSLTSDEIEVFFDPQIYATYETLDENLLKKITSYEDYVTYRPKRWYEREANVSRLVNKTINYQRDKQFAGIIAPNIVIEESFKNRTSIISKNFIYSAQEQAQSLGIELPVYATFAIDREALLDHEELMLFLNDITLIAPRPQGFYLLISSRDTVSRSELMHSDVIAGTLIINYVLAMNDFKVINGYSDILTPYYGAVGAYAGATGWWSNLRQHSMSIFRNSRSGGRLPIQRYLSVGLMARILHTDLNAWRTIVPEIVNGLESDDIFINDNGNEPERALEVLQWWDAIRSMNEKYSSDSIKQNLDDLTEHISRAEVLYAEIERAGFRPEQSANQDHLRALREGIKIFRNTVELN